MMNKASMSTGKPAMKPGEEGYILLLVMFMLAVLIIAMAVALPKVAADIQRDRELETMHRGMQYRRAIQLYYRKFNRYPPNIEALVKTNEIRFLRKQYVDPTTGKKEWKTIMMGQNKTPMAMGFFGQPLAGVGGGAGIAGATDPGVPMGTGTGSTSPGAGSIFAPTNSAATNTPVAGAGAAGTSSDPTAGGTTDANGNPTDPNSAATGQLGANGQQFGGAGIIGVSPMSPKKSILSYKKKTHYNEWEFLYSPLSDQMQMGTGMQNPAAGSILGTGTGTGTSPTSPTSPTTPITPSPQQ